MNRAMPLYLMTKPPRRQCEALRRCVSTFGLDAGYQPDRYHTTLLRLGESQTWSPVMMDSLCGLLRNVDAEPCPIGFDRIDGNILRGRNGLTGLRAFQRMLAWQVARLGFALPVHDFWPHLTLAYRGASSANGRIEPISWLVEEFLLVRSVHGVGHELLGRWPLRRRQYELPF